MAAQRLIRLQLHKRTTRRRNHPPAAPPDASEPTISPYAAQEHTSALGVPPTGARSLLRPHPHLTRNVDLLMARMAPMANSSINDSFDFHFVYDEAEYEEEEDDASGEDCGEDSLEVSSLVIDWCCCSAHFRPMGRLLRAVEQRLHLELNISSSHSRE
ncbi:MAG: hypothetical protein SGPRY_001305, partial [Prymnesium sp.]